ncbi:MAG: peroxiredoxin family protein [Thermodesulfobacteriota bacterium]
MTKRIIQIVILLLLSLFVVVSPSWAAWLNDNAPDFTLPDLNAQSVSLSDMRGNVVYVNFWATWCPPCKKELPQLNKLAEKYADAKFIILAVNIDRKRSIVDKFLTKYLPFSNKMRILLDPKSKAVASYAARAMPTSFIIDKEGTIRYVHLGFREADPAKWASEIETLLK